MSGYLPAIGAKEIEPLEMVDRAAREAQETREGPEALRRKIWRDESGAEIWVHYEGEAPRTTTVIFRGAGQVTGRLAGISPPADGPQNGQILLIDLQPELAPRLVLDLAEYGDAITRICTGRRVRIGIAGLLKEGQLFENRAAYLVAASRKGSQPAVQLRPVGLCVEGDRPEATLVGTLDRVEERRNSLSGEPFLALTVEWDGRMLELAASHIDLTGARPAQGAYLSGRVWLVGYDLEYATAVPSDPSALPFEPGTVAAFTGINGYLQLLQVIRIEPLAPGGLVVHLRVFGELFPSLEALQQHQAARQIAVGHLPLDAGALLDSDFMPLGTAPLTAVDEAAYQAWRQAFERGEAGVLGIPLDQVVQLLGQAQQANQPADETAAETI